MIAVGIKPNVRTYTTLMRGWARASLPEKALKCFELMKIVGLKPDRPAFHCLITSLLSRATVAEEYIYSGILSVCKEMVELNLTVDMDTAVHWSKCLRKIETSGGELTETMQKTFPPDWNSYKVLQDTNKMERNTSDTEHDEDEIDGNGQQRMIEEDNDHRSWF